jgi:hypothetical protein
MDGNTKLALNMNFVSSFDGNCIANSAETYTANICVILQ